MIIHILPLPSYSSKWKINKHNFEKSLHNFLDYCVKWSICSSPLKKDEITINLHLINKKYMQHINKKHRGIDKPTNVLAFSSDPLPVEIDAPRDLGDVFICREVIEQEAIDQNKRFQDHLAHMVVHGTLHLLGYDHEDENDEIKMKNKEIYVLSKLGIDNPYSLQKAQE